MMCWNQIRGIAVTVAVMFAPAVSADESGWEAAKRPDAVILMRHALAPGIGDPANFDLADCATQRNLNDEGREQARVIGEAFKSKGIDVNLVLTSQWCRCRETAVLLDLGPVQDFSALNSFFEDRSTATAQSADTLAYLKVRPEDQRTLLVTHQVNISALASMPTRSGEMVVVDVTSEGDVEILGRILIDP